MSTEGCWTAARGGACRGAGASCPGAGGRPQEVSGVHWCLPAGAGAPSAVTGGSGTWPSEVARMLGGKL